MNIIPCSFGVVFVSHFHTRPPVTRPPPSSPPRGRTSPRPAIPRGCPFRRSAAAPRRPGAEVAKFHRRGARALLVPALVGRHPHHAGLRPLLPRPALEHSTPAPHPALLQPLPRPLPLPPLAPPSQVPFGLGGRKPPRLRGRPDVPPSRSQRMVVWLGLGTGAEPMVVVCEVVGFSALRHKF